jgi:hypothetical protein
VSSFGVANWKISVNELTRYMNETAVVEVRTHEELVESGGDYAHMWSLQAEAFM